MSENTNRPPLNDEMYTVAEVARYFKVTTAAVYKWMNQGKLAYVYAGKDRRVTRAAIRAFVAASTAEGKPGGDSSSTIEIDRRKPTQATAVELAA